MEQGLGESAQPSEQPFCLFQVLDTYMFHSFLKARLNRRMDAFAQMDLDTQSEEDRCFTVMFWIHSSLGITVSKDLSFIQMSKQESQREMPCA